MKSNQIKRYKATWLRDCLQLGAIMFVLYLLLSSFTTIKDNNEIEYRQLNYNDFVVIPKFNDIRVAESNTGISYELIGNRFVAKAVFEKDKSFIAKNLASNKIAYILRHEQGHFDITEYITRKLNARLSGIKDYQVAEKLFDQAIIELENMQSRYDKETDHSENVSSQEEWTTRIRGLLLLK